MTREGKVRAKVMDKRDQRSRTCEIEGNGQVKAKVMEVKFKGMGTLDR